MGRRIRIRHWWYPPGTFTGSVHYLLTAINDKLIIVHALALDKVSPHNWLDDNFWINKAYLEWRAPLLVNSNWWLAFHDDPTIPTSALSGETNNNRAGTTFWQIRRSAWLIHRMLQFKGNIAETYVRPSTIPLFKTIY